jgi:hypothetical protein
MSIVVVGKEEKEFLNGRPRSTHKSEPFDPRQSAPDSKMAQALDSVVTGQQCL